MEDFYKENYANLFYSDGKSSTATKFIHKALESKFAGASFDKVLEIGGGEGFHVPYVIHKYQKYYLTDIKPRKLHGPTAEIEKTGRLLYSPENAEELTFPDNFFDRTIIMCLLHHVNDVTKTLSEARRVTKSGGVISVYLPCDPGFIYRILRAIFVHKRARKLKINYQLINAIEHKNHYSSIYIILHDIFKHDAIKELRFPFFLRSWNINIFNVVHIMKK